MKYNYEFLRKCHGLRFRAEIFGKPAEGIVKVDNDKVFLCHGKDLLGYPDVFHRAKVTMFFCEDVSQVGVSAFEIVPRDPETYKDWQVGDEIIKEDTKYVVIFRCGEVVLFKDRNNICYPYPYTCEELFNDGGRLVLTDVEKQIIEGQKKYEPQDGEVCYLRGNFKWIFVKKDDPSCFDMYAGLCLERGNLYYDDTISSRAPEELRPATDEEKQKLFDALAKDGKRWNAEKKCIEDIPKPCEFKKGDPVLVRDERNRIWRLRAFEGKSEDPGRPYRAMFDSFFYNYRYCIPYNEETMHLLGTTEDYKEGE